MSFSDELIAPTVTTRAVERFRPRIAAIVDSALNSVAGRTDVLTGLAYPIPIAVTTELLDSVAAVVTLTAFLLPILAQRGAVPGDDLLSALLSAEVDGDRLDPEEVVATVILLLLGQETTANLIGNGVLALLGHPDQLELLRRRPDLVGSTVDEILRLDGPVMLCGRTALVDKHVGGQHIKPGQPLLLHLGAANRDPVRFPEPDTLDITRDHGANIAFGSGPHLCLGAALAHVQAAETLLRLFDRYSDIQLPAGDEWRPRWRRSTAFRALDSLPVQLSP